jgi:type I restriction enzyme M protein
MLTPESKSKIHQLWDKLWSSRIATRYAVIEQISCLIFIKWLEVTTEKYQRRLKEEPGIPEDMKWSYIRNMTGAEERLNHVANKVFPWLKTLPPAEFPFSAQLADVMFLIPTPLLLEESMQIIESMVVEIKSQSGEVPDLQDTLGDVYYYLLHEISFTESNAPPSVPAHILDLISELAKPAMQDVICDPSCGTGDLLVCAGQQVLKAYTRKNFRYTDENGFEKGTQADLIPNDQLRRYFELDMFFGYEKDTAQLRLATMNLMLHEVDRPNVSNEDILSPAFDSAKVRSFFTLVICNLPYATRAGSPFLPIKTDSKPEEVFWLERIIDMMAPGGRAVVMVSTQLFSDAAKVYQDARRALFETCNVQGAIRYPMAISNASAGAIGAILIFTKMPAGKKRQIGSVAKKTFGKVWFCNMANDGYSKDEPRSKLTINPLPELVKAFYHRHSKKADAYNFPDNLCFFVPLEEIAKKAFTLDILQYVKDDAAESNTNEKLASSSISVSLEKAITAIAKSASSLEAAGAAVAGAAPDFYSALRKFMSGSANPTIKTFIEKVLTLVDQAKPAATMSPIQQFIAFTYNGTPFTFRQLSTDLRQVDGAIGFDQLHKEVWEMLKQEEPLLIQVYYGPQMAYSHREAYQFLRNNKAEECIYLLYIGESIITT